MMEVFIENIKFSKIVINKKLIRILILSVFSIFFTCLYVSAETIAEEQFADSSSHVWSKVSDVTGIININSNKFSVKYPAIGLVIDPTNKTIGVAFNGWIYYQSRHIHLYNKLAMNLDKKLILEIPLSLRDYKITPINGYIAGYEEYLVGSFTPEQSQKIANIVTKCKMTYTKKMFGSSRSLNGCNSILYEAYSNTGGGYNYIVFPAISNFYDIFIIAEYYRQRQGYKYI